MKIVDTHCDLLYKLQKAKRKNRPLDVLISNELDTNVTRLHRGGVYVQFFAIFVPPSVSAKEKWQYAKEQVELFHEVVCQSPNVRWIQRWEDIFSLRDDEIGAVLALEGVEAIQQDLDRLYYLYERGLRSVGLTWNEANAAASGVQAKKDHGLTTFGEAIIDFNNRNQVLTDLSHLGERSFWDVIEKAKYVFSSHSNVRAVCNHPRNLSDFQLQALFAKGGLVSLNFYPPFLQREKKNTSLETIVAHIDYIVQLGGVSYISFGSDFDGIDKYVLELRHAGCYQTLIDYLFLHYDEEVVRLFSYKNFERFILQIVGE
ncbi:MAG TPA: dipeptidase [Pseudogracilibacillus sp.]|nr:dipeptidase [Pseudogracilibacillus sp.]